MTDWIETRFTEKPKTLFKVAPDIYMQVRNLKFLSDEEGWVCETREVTESELKLLSQISEQAKEITDIELALAEIVSTMGG